MKGKEKLKFSKDIIYKNICKYILWAILHMMIFKIIITKAKYDYLKIYACQNRDKQLYKLRGIYSSIKVKSLSGVHTPNLHYEYMLNVILQFNE